MRRAIICFTRVPKPGVTKTRLLPILKGEQCADLHTAFLRDLYDVYSGIDADLFVAYTPDPDWKMLESIFPFAVELFVQTGDDLGQRMHNAICYVLSQEYDACVLTGADLPMITAEHVESGFASLENVDIVIGPTSDGGYYLVGVKQPCLELFTDQQYGGSNVYENTVAAAGAAGYSVASALCCDDVDTPEDLKCLIGQVRSGSHTAEYLDYLRKEGVLI